jgi:hypothetical protein
MKKHILIGVFFILYSNALPAQSLYKKVVKNKQRIFEMQRILATEGYLKYICCDTTIYLWKDKIKNGSVLREMAFFDFDEIIIYGKIDLHDVVCDSSIEFYKFKRNYFQSSRSVSVVLGRNHRNIKKYSNVEKLDTNLYYSKLF